MQTIFEQYSNIIFCFYTEQQLFYYCLNSVSLLLVKVRLFLQVLLALLFENIVLLLLVNFAIFGILFCILFKYCFITVWMGRK